MTDTYQSDLTQLQNLFTKLETQIEEVESIRKENSG